MDRVEPRAARCPPRIGSVEMGPEERELQREETTPFPASPRNAIPVIPSMFLPAG